MACDRSRLGSTVCSACHAAAALECHRHGSDLQQKRLAAVAHPWRRARPMRVGADPDGLRPAAARQHRLQRLPRRGCRRVPPARLGSAAEKGRPPLLFPRASKSLLLIRRAVRRYGFFGSLDGPERFSDPLRPRPAMTRVAPASIPPVSFGICRRGAVAPDTRSSAAEREISWKGTCPSMDTTAVPRTPRLSAVDAAGRATSRHRWPTCAHHRAAQPPCTLQAIRAA